MGSKIRKTREYRQTTHKIKQDTKSQTVKPENSANSNTEGQTEKTIKWLAMQE